MFGYLIEHAFAGLGHLIWHWGTGIGLIIILLALAWFTQAVPIIGPYLTGMRKDLLWAALAVGVFLFGMATGIKDERRVCTAQTVVVTKYVGKAVEKTKTPRARAEKDPYDNPDN